MTGERRPGTVGFALPGVSVRIAEPESGAPVRPAGSASSRSRVRTCSPATGGCRRRRRRSFARTAISSPATWPGRRRRLHPHRRAREGPRHFRRLQRLSQGGRDRDRCDRGRARKRRVRRAACRFRRRRDGGRRAASRRGADRSGDPRGARRAAWPSSRRRSGSSSSNSLPRNAMGKVQKAVLREAYKDIYRG